MMKPGLGKGLGRLMNGDQVAGRAPAASEMGRGLNTLIAVQPPAKEPPVQPRKPLLPAWFFFAADLLLLAYAVAIFFAAPKPIDLGSLLFCGVSVALGAVLAIVGVLRVSARE